MSLTLDTTLSGQYSNSYVDVAYADSYWAEHWNQAKASEWAALSTQQKTTLLIGACRVIETARFTTHTRLRTPGSLTYSRQSRTVLFLNDTIIPIKYAYYQRLQFPRSVDLDIGTGATFIPAEIKMAQCEQALYLLELDDSVLSSAMQGVQLDQVAVGPIHTRQKLSKGGTMFSPWALELIRPFLIKSAPTRRA